MNADIFVVFRDNDDTVVVVVVVVVVVASKMDYLLSKYIEMMKILMLDDMIEMFGRGMVVVHLQYQMQVLT